MRPRALSLRFAPCALVVALLAGCGDDVDPDGGGGAGAGGSNEGGTNAGGSNEGGGGGGGSGLSPEVETCLFINACEADGGTPIGMQACLAHPYERQWRWASSGSYRLGLEAMECRFAATDCEGVRACDTDPTGFDAACAEQPGTTLCDGGTWVVCGDDGVTAGAFDCAAAGKECNVDIWAGCGTEPCTFGQTEATCDPDDPTVLVSCNPSGFLERTSCDLENNFVIVHGTEGDEPSTIAGETCGDDPMLGSKGCIGTGDACDFFSQACDGDVLVTCAGGKLAHRDCAALHPAGQGCGFNTSGPFAGGAACGVVESACDPAEPEACDAGTITFCAQGLAQTIACAEAGFAGCDTATREGRTVAFCN